MKDFFNSKYGSHILVLISIILVTTFYVPRNANNKTLSKIFPGYFQGKVPVQSDNQQYKGAASEVHKYGETEDETILWTNSLFCGMPTYTIANPTTGVIIKHMLYPKNPRIWAKIFLYLICAYIMLIAFEVRPWLAFVGAIAIGFATENFTILSVGHNTKAAAIGYLPLIVAGCQFLFRKKYIVGLAVLSAGMALQIFVNHVQITYYGGMFIGLFFIYELINHIKQGRIKDYAVAGVLAVLGAGIALGANSLNLLLLDEYAAYSIRGGSDLTISPQDAPTDNTKGGLTKDYVFSYSMGWTDYFATVIPNYSGGDSDKIGLYYGDIGQTSGPKYLGATTCILMILGLILVPGWRKWWLVTAMILTVVLSMGGNNFVWFNTLMYKYFPLYDKFRAPSIMIVIMQVSVGLLAILGVENFLRNPKVIGEKMKPLKIAVISAFSIIVLLVFTGSMFNDFRTTPKYDENGIEVYDQDKVMAQRMNTTPDRLVDARVDLMKTDGYRSLFLVLLVLAVIWFTYKQKIKPQYAVLFLGLLITIDVWAIGKRYLNDKEFKRPKVVTEPFKPYNADLAILEDKDYYRVLDLTESPLNSNRCPYFHKSIGGYSAVKIRRYQDLWDWYLMNDLNKGKVQNNNILNMLNMKYFIFPNQQEKGGQPQYGINPTALGNAWIIGNVKVVENADSAILNLKNLDTKVEGIAEAVHADLVSSNTQIDSGATITLTSYHPEKLEYKYNSNTESNVAFSEIFYEAGWDAYIDDEKVDHYRLNYTIRGLKVPSGSHNIRFEFAPQTYKTGSSMATIFGGLIYGLIGLALFFWIKTTFIDKKEEEADTA